MLPLYYVITAIILAYAVLKNLPKKRKDLKNEVILVTGAGHGLGQLLCIELSKYCKNIIGWDIDENGLNDTANLVKKNSGFVMKCQRCDISNAENIDECFSKLEDDYKHVSILINNAGIVHGKYVLDLSREQFEKIMKVNVLGAFYTTQAVLPSMLGNEYNAVMTRIPRVINAPSRAETPLTRDGSAKGHLVYMSSLAGGVPIPGLADYCATKAALTMFSDGLRSEFDKLKISDKIIVTDIRPYTVSTGMFDGFQAKTPTFNILTPEAVSKRVVEAILQEDEIVCIPWHSWMASFFLRLFPLAVSRRAFAAFGTHDAMNSFGKENKKSA